MHTKEEIGTVREHTEEALRESEERFRAIWEFAGDAMALSDPEGTVLSANPAYCELYGYAPEEVIGKSFAVIFPPQLREWAVAEYHKTFADPQIAPAVEASVQRKDGSQRMVESGYTFIERDGHRTAMISVIRDVTERKRAEEALRDREQLLDSVISASPDIITILDHEGRIRSASPAVSRLLGYVPEERLGRHALEFIHEEDRERVASALRAGFDGETDITKLRYRSRHAAGGWVLLEGSGRPIKAADGRGIGTVVVSRDVTDQAKFEEELQRAKEEAERANLAKSQFLSRMSHELRTPLNVILGFAQVLEMDSTSLEQTEYVGHILGAGHHLLNLINEVLDIARIEEDALHMSIEPVPIGEVVQEALDLVQRLALQRNISLQTVIAREHSPYVLADRQRLKQVLLNLLSNAIKYNREGGTVILSCNKLNEAKLCIKVSDTGHGIPPDKIEQLFVPFQRLGAEQTTIEGTGLGLSLSKRLVEGMSGTISVESAVGQGSTFSVELPLAESQVQQMESTEADPSAIRKPYTEDMEERLILYIEDNLSNLKLIERVLQRSTNHKLLVAMQGRLGLDLAREHKPNLILMDQHLPDISGREVLRRLKAEPETAEIPVVIISADATPGQIRRFLAAGARAYLTKPLNVSQFLEVLEDTIDSKESVA